MSADSKVVVAPVQCRLPLSDVSQLPEEEGKDWFPKVGNGNEKVSEHEQGSLEAAFLLGGSFCERKKANLMLLFVVIVAVAAGTVVGVCRSNQTIEGLVTVQPSINPVALKNPLKGWRGQISRYAWGSIPINNQGIPFSQPIWYTQPQKNLESIRKWYANWNELESGNAWEHNNETLAIERIRKVTDRYLSAMPSRNMKALPRLEVFTKEGFRGPADLPQVNEIKVDGEILNGDREHPWWKDAVVKKRVERIIRRIGIVWDTDPRVAAVQVGTQGKYGEMWALNRMPEVEEYISKAYQKAFTNKKLMIRSAGPYEYANSIDLANSYSWGFYLDSFALRDSKFSKGREAEMEEILKLDEGNRWKVSPIGGEAYIKENSRKAEFSPGRVTPGIFKDMDTRNYMFWCLRYAHTSWLGSGEGEQLEGGDVDVIHKFHKAMGYRFELGRVSFSAYADPDSKLTIGFEVRNTGSAPFMENWPLIISLAEPGSKFVAWKRQMTSIDLRKWLPGENPSRQTGLYEKEPVFYSEQESFEVTGGSSMAPGRYIVCLSIEDPSPPSRPAVRFATNNYWQGGLHPIGEMIWNDPDLTENNPVSFEDVFTNSVDLTLAYSSP